MRFADPQWLWALTAIPLIGVAGWLMHLRRRAALCRFSGSARNVALLAVSISWHRRAIKLILLYAALVAFPLALARPQWGTRIETVTRRGADVAIVLDTSLSMATEDLAPSRLAQAKHAISTLLDRIPGDRVALISFAGEAHLSCPLTVDQAAIRLFLDALDVDAVAVPGTALADALTAALSALQPANREADARDRVVVLFSDGEDHAGGLEPVLETLKRSGVRVFSVGCGTERGGPIPIRGAAGKIDGYKKDKQDRVVTTRIHEELLQQIALATSGRYYRATAGEVEIEELAGELEPLEGGELGTSLRRSYEERFQFLLFPAWLALLVETLLGDRRRRRTPATEEQG